MGGATIVTWSRATAPGGSLPVVAARTDAAVVIPVLSWRELSSRIELVADADIPLTKIAAVLPIRCERLTSTLPSRFVVRLSGDRSTGMFAAIVAPSTTTVLAPATLLTVIALFTSTPGGL